jgi:hypothetical protein
VRGLDGLGQKRDFSVVIQTVSKFKNLKKIDSYFPFKAKIRAKWYLRYPFVVKIMYLYPISKSGTLLRHSLIASEAWQHA